MPRTGQPSTRDVEATVRAVEILDALADGGELGTSEVARRTGISPSTVSRQLGTLTRVGLVEHVTATGRYRLGVRTLRYANAVLGRLNLRDLARPHLEELVHEVGETATLSIPGEADAITVDFVPTDRYLQGVTRLGRPSVGHASSAGKVMLAFGDVVTPRSKLTAFTPRTITDPAALAAEIERVRGARLRRGDRGARGRPERDRRTGLGRRLTSSPRSWPCRARRADSTATRSPRRSAPRQVRRADLGRARLASRSWQLSPAEYDSRLTPTPLRA